MAGITEALGGTTRSRADRFAELSEGKTVEDVRLLEMQLLKPEPMVEPACASPSARGVVDTKVALYIPPKRYWRIFLKFFKVSRMGERSNGTGIARGENSVRDINVFLALLDGLITGKLKYNVETKTIEAGLSARQEQLITEFQVVCRTHIEAEEQDAPGTTASLVDEIFTLLDDGFGASLRSKKV